LISALRSKNNDAYEALSHDRIAGAYVHSHRPGRDDSDTDVETDDELDDSPYLVLHRTRTRESIVEVDRPRGELILVVVEEAAVLAQFGLRIAGLLAVWHSSHRKARIAAIAQVCIWLYIGLLASVRLGLSSQKRVKFSKLWYHTCFIYCVIWFFSALTFRSAIIHPRLQFAQSLTIADFALTTLLALIALTSRKGNRPVTLEYEGDLIPSKEQTASVFSLGTFTWVDAIVWTGYKKTYEIEDVWNLPPHDKASWLIIDYRQLRKTSSLAFHLLKYFKRSLLIQASWAAFSGVLTFVPTLLLKFILEYVENPSQTPQNAAWFYVILLLVSSCADAVANGQSLWIGRKICIRLRAIIIGEIYAKALKRKVSATSDKILGQKEKSDKPKAGLLQWLVGTKKDDDESEEPSSEDETQSKSDAQVTSGTIINLMAVDSFKVSEICAYLHFLWASTPVQFVGSIALLYRILGFSSFVGIGMMGLLLPINMLISNKFNSIQKEILAATDERIHTTNEVLSNIRIIKFFAWEQRFMSLVGEKRSLEIKHIRRRYVVWAFAATVWSGAPIVITLLSFAVYTKVEKKDLVPSIAFTALSLFQILRIPLDQLADMIAHVMESKVSVGRVEEFLAEPETDKFHQLQEKFDEDDRPVIGFDNTSFSWGSKGHFDTDAFKLLDLDFNFKTDGFNVIVGPTGSGKTSLLLALLGEMTLLQGDVYLPGNRSREDLDSDPDTGLFDSVAYCAQTAWLVNDTIKENIVFASPWDQKRYKQVIAACSLERDLEILDAGDQTLVGEKGVTLSGGQKQRISLARALYSRARHIILDDVLSAVDAHTSKWIFEQAILGPLMANRTCILVTHSVALCLPHADFAVVLENGRVLAKGTAKDVVSSGKLTDDLSKSMTLSRGTSKAPSRIPSEIAEDSMEATSANGVANGKVDKTQKPAHTETKAEGGVKLGIILLYLRAMGSWWYWSLAALSFVVQQLISVATNLWIREWSNQYATEDVSIQGEQWNSSVSHISGSVSFGSCLKYGSCGFTMPFRKRPGLKTTVNDGAVNVDYYLWVYAGIGLVFMISTLGREIILFWGSIQASHRIHDRLMEHVTRAKFRFFDSTPLGQIMNRFSKDIEAVDQEVTPAAVGVIYCFASIVTIVILISVITPGFLIAGIFISVLYFLIGMFYIHSSRDLKRLESVQRSPLYQQFGETLSGMTTIRAYGDERRFVRDNLDRINSQNRPFIYLWAANRWLAFRVDVVGALVSFFSGTFVLLRVGRIDAGAAGLALTYAVTFTENVLWFVRLYASNEQNMNSVERIKEYLDVEQEAPPIIPDNRPPGNWPSHGSVEFIGYSTRYRNDFDFVLKKLTFKVSAGEKVGVVGRTGAGKSSMALALFRALEAEEGKILVDDVDIGLIGLQDLREKIVMVPQGKYGSSHTSFLH
jgi:ABC-type multidrug transport system fused ATPase/permease subunit